MIFQDWPDNPGTAERTSWLQVHEEERGDEPGNFVPRESAEGLQTAEAHEPNSQLATPPATGHGPRRAVRQPAAAARLNTALRTTEELTGISRKDQEIREQYYKRKLELYERQVIAHEQLVLEVQEIKELVREACQNRR